MLGLCYLVVFYYILLIDKHIYNVFCPLSIYTVCFVQFYRFINDLLMIFIFYLNHGKASNICFLQFVEPLAGSSCYTRDFIFWENWDQYLFHPSPNTSFFFVVITIFLIWFGTSRGQLGEI